MHRLILSACLCAVSFSTATLLAADADSPRLFVLVAADTTDEVHRDGAQQNMKWIRDAFSAHVPAEQLLVRFLAGDKLTCESLLASIDQCPVREADTLVLWWLGRGKFAEEARILLMPDGSELAAGTVRDHVVARPARLAVVVLDACERSLPAEELPAKTLEPALATHLTPIFQSLFFEPAGLVEIDAGSPGERPLSITRIGGLLTCGLVLPPGALGDVDNEAGSLVLNTPTGQREMVLERGLLWRSRGESIRWDTVLAQLRSTTTANYRRAWGRGNAGTGQTPGFGDTRLKYADHFIEWHPAFDEFRSRPRESRVVLEDGQPVQFQGDREVITRQSPADHAGTDSGDASIQGNQSGGAEDPDIDVTLDPDDFEMIPGDHLIEINGNSICSAQQFDAAMQGLAAQAGQVEFVVVDNQTGRRIHLHTHMDPRTDTDFGIVPWYWKDSLVIIHDIRPDSPAARAEVTRIVQSELPPEVGLGIRGAWVEVENPLHGDEKLVGVKVTEVTDASRSDLKPGDVVFMIDGYNFATEAGYRYALRNARVLCGLWLIDGQSGEVRHGHALLPHTPAGDMSEPPDDVMMISITPSDMDSCPIW
jgi:hypothetical protein